MAIINNWSGESMRGILCRNFKSKLMLKDQKSSWFFKYKHYTFFILYLLIYMHYGHECEQAPGVGDRQGSLACCSP